MKKFDLDDIDAVIENADWTKRTWDLPPKGTPEFESLKIPADLPSQKGRPAAQTEVREHAQRDPARLRDYAEIDEGLKAIDTQALEELEAALIPQRDATLIYVRRALEGAGQSPEWVNALEFDPGIDFSVAVEKMFQRSWFFARGQIWEREYWDPDQHPRHPAGSDQGGEFAPSDAANKPGNWQQMTPEEQRAWRDMDNKRQKEQRAARKAKKADEPPKVEVKMPAEKKAEPPPPKPAKTGAAYEEFSKLPPKERTVGAAMGLLVKHEGQAKMMGPFGSGMDKAEMLHETRLAGGVIMQYPPTYGGRLTAATMMKDYSFIPPELHLGTKQITILEQSCSMNKQFEGQYGMKNFKAWGTASYGDTGSIKIYDAHPSVGALKHPYGLNHEMAHQTANYIYGSSSPPANSPFGKLWDKYSAPGIKSVTAYSKKNSAEFFADGVAYIQRSPGTYRTLFPDIAAAYDQTLADIRKQFKNQVAAMT